MNSITVSSFQEKGVQTAATLWRFDIVQGVMYWRAFYVH